MSIKPTKLMTLTKASISTESTRLVQTVEDSIFKFDIILQLFQDKDESIKKWLVNILKIVNDNNIESLSSYFEDCVR